jgi:hypothetical protein
VLRRGGERLVDGQRLVQLRKRLVGLAGFELFLGGGTLARAGAEPVDAEPPRELREPGPDGGVVPQLVEVLVRAREHFLEDVLRVGLGQPERLDRDRVDIAREALHQLAPRLLVAGAAARDELAVTQSRGHHTDCYRSKGWGQTPSGSDPLKARSPRSGVPEIG